MNNICLNELLQLSVKIECCRADKTSLGTGAIISDGKMFYVMTAAHCIKYSCNEAYQPTEICIKQYLENKWREITVRSIVACEFDEQEDYAILEIEAIDNDFDYFKCVKCCDQCIDEEEYAFLGYTQLYHTGRCFPIKRSGTSSWHLKEGGINNQDLTAKELMEGNSGAGIFFKRYGVYYYVGFIKRILDVHGSFNDLVFHPVRLFYGKLADTTRENIVDLVDKWMAIENDNMIDDEMIAEYRENNIQYVNNLTRKLKVLFPEDNELKQKVFLNNYLKGLKLDIILKDKNILRDKLIKSDIKIFNDFKTYRSTQFDNNKEACEDLKELHKNLKIMSSKVVYHDNECGVLATDYTNYSIAEKLLVCSLDYKNRIL